MNKDIDDQSDGFTVPAEKEQRQLWYCKEQGKGTYLNLFTNGREKSLLLFLIDCAKTDGYNKR